MSVLDFLNAGLHIAKLLSSEFKKKCFEFSVENQSL